MATFETLIDGLSFTECPRWHDGALYLSDFYTHRVLRVTTDGRAETVAEVPNQPSGLGFLPDGRLLIVSMRDRRILRSEDGGGLVEHADLSSLAPWHLNDMLVDADGGAYVGNFGFDLMGGAAPTTTVLLRIDPDGSARVAADGLGFPNGMALTPDGRTLVVAESLGARLTAFDVDGGSLDGRRDWAVLPDGAVPDGICMDAEGAVWVADAANARLLRVAEGGTVLDDLATGTNVFACMLGGDDGRSLFACAAPTFHEAEAAADHRASIIWTTVDVPHAGLP